MEKNSQAVIPDNIVVVEGDGLNPVPTPEAGDAGKVLGVLNSSGDIGWVEDQGGTLTQVQSDWAENDSSKVSYIDNKPDLSVYATTSAVNTALAGKQDTISDLSEIRAGAAKGDTAVQPATLESYATTSAMNTALSGKQDVISDLATIRSGAASGATAVQPSALESYATTSAMNTALAGKQDVINDLATIRSGAALGATAAQPGDLPSSDELVPSASSGDSGKVLTVDAQGNPSWQTPTSVTVDQTYNASSTHAQSGTAVAQAIAAIPSSSYTAGDGIDISGSTISADFTEVQSALDFGSDFTFDNPTQYTATTADGGYMVVIPTDSATKFTLPGTLGNWPSADSGVTVQLQVGSGSTWTTLKSGNYSMLESLPSDFYTDVDIPAGMSGKYIRWFCTYTSWYQTQNVNLYIYNFDTTAKCFTVPGTGTLALANPVTAGDGVEVTAGEVSVDIADTLDFVPKTVTTTYTTTPDGYQYVPLPIDLRSTVLSSTAKLTIQFPLNSFYSMDPLSKPIRIGVSDANGNKLVSSEVSLTYHQQSNRWFIDEQTVTVSCPASDWEYSSGSTVSSITRLIVIPADSNGMSSALYSTSGSGTITFTLAQPDPNRTVVTVRNPLPASAQADSGKVLKVNASGNAEWGTDGFTTTAGITDIQVVNALPASPVATVLYLLPET